MTTVELENELLQLKVRLFKTEVRLEALLRLLYSSGSLTRDVYQNAIDNFQAMNNALAKINNVPSIMDKVNAANEFNKNTDMKIHADDLGIKKIIEDAGGTSDFTARFILAKLPCSSQFTQFISQFLDPTKTPSPDALMPDQVINK